MVAVEGLFNDQASRTEREIIEFVEAALQF